MTDIQTEGQQMTHKVRFFLFEIWNPKNLVCYVFSRNSKLGPQVRWLDTK